MAEKILIVDDDLETLRLVGLMLQGQGYKIVAASNGAQAITLARSENPDLILLDVMMADMDGFEVARRLRADPAVFDVPILMFTAKAEMDDKIVGYEAGADDYLTKPVHPVELLSHVKTLIARTKKVFPEATPHEEHGQIIAVLAARGGLGTSTLALNLGVSLAQRIGLDVILAEFRPGRGSWAYELNSRSTGLLKLLNLEINLITSESVQAELIRHSSGVRLLLASSQPDEASLAADGAHLAAILDRLGILAQVVLVDVGNSSLAELTRILALCSQAIVVVDPNPVTISMTRDLLDGLRMQGFGQAKALSLAMVQRFRFATRASLAEIEEQLKLPLAQVISPFPELAYQANQSGAPLLMVQPQGLAAQQFGALAQRIAQLIPPI
jgi:CheY-like chemotaxis protein/MinD-like ATPase involved in chromosome partitioning or flagellar assembly